MKLSNSLMLVAAAAMAFVGCQVKEFDNTVTANTHKVTFVADMAQTKTAMTEGEECATFEWTSGDLKNFQVYENGKAAADVEPYLDEDGKLIILACWDEAGVPAAESYTYTAILNGHVEDLQVVSSADEHYDEASDVLVAEPVVFDADQDLEEVELVFNRISALNKMTLKGFVPGEKIESINITSTGAIAADYDLNNEAWINAVSALDIDFYYDAVADEDGEFAVYFSTVPVTEATFTVSAIAETAEYSKTFSKPITLNAGELNRFSATVIAEESDKVPGYIKVTEEPTDWSGDYIIVYEDTEKAPGLGKVFNGTDAGKDYVASKIYNGTIAAAAEGMAEVKIAAMNDGYSLLVTNGTNKDKYMGGTKDKNSLTFNDSAVLNTISFDDETALVTITSNTSILMFNTTAGDTNDRFRYYKPTNSYPVVYLYKKALIDPIPVTHAESVSLDMTQATVLVGKTVTLVATVNPADAVDKTVTWSSDNKSVATVENGVVTGVATGTANITVTTVDGNKTATCAVTVSAPAAAYTLVTDASTLKAGDVIVLGCAAKEAAAGTFNEGKFFTSVSATFKDGILSCDEALEITLGGEAGAWILETSEGSISTSAAKALILDGTGTQKTCTITITDGAADITFGDKGTIRYNASSPRFLNYASGQTPIEIYKK